MIGKVKESIRINLLFWASIFFIFNNTYAQTKSNMLSFQTENLKIYWAKSNKIWKINKIENLRDGKTIPVDSLSGSWTYLYTDQKVGKSNGRIFKNQGKIFPEPSFTLMSQEWKNITDSVHLHLLGSEFKLFPHTIRKKNEGIELVAEDDKVEVLTSWETDPELPQIIKIKTILKPKIKGYFSLQTQHLISIPNKDLAYGTIPGVFAGKKHESDIIKSFAYGHGIPNMPLLVQEKTATLPAPILVSNENFSIAVLADEKFGRDPWADSVETHMNWNLGLSIMDRDSLLKPSIFYPVLSNENASLNAGQSIDFEYKFCFYPAKDWFDIYRFMVDDLSNFNDFLKLKNPKQSLADRVKKLYQYLKDPKLSLWRISEYQGHKIGAQDYLGGVLGSQNDAIKNADYGTMWMLAELTQDSILLNERLPFARQFKLAQQIKDSSFFEHALAGQYFLHKSKRFTEEWGDYSEPIGITFYLINDVGNMLLFNPKDKELRNVLKLASEKLLDWMKPNGEWAIAYDHQTNKELFTELKDYRPTFYGLLTAYKLLNEKKYLIGAVKGADWLLENAVSNNFFYGDCGDTRFIQDFGTAQTSQAFLDLYDVTKESKYLDAAIQVARFYCTSIYTHPIPTKKLKTVNGISVEDWQISQVGLNFEHGGALGSATDRGPITLTSHAGLFVRMFQLTNDSLFLDMARAGAWAREAFNDHNAVASYYWDSMNEGPGPFPHHAWWQIGWIMDYLISELELRSNGNIHFPAGFFTPKVGPHKTYGYDYGKVFSDRAKLIFNQGVEIDNPAIEYLSAKNNEYVYLFLMNNSLNNQEFKISNNLLATKISLHNSKGESLREISPKNLVDQTFLINPTGLLILKMKVN